jgi:prepilin-type N-terminal cleavage/methylation domain-containing protein
MSKNNLTFENFRFGFTLVELLAVVVIGTLLVIASIGVYGQMQQSANEMNDVMESRNLPGEILQRIAEDLDKIIAPLSGEQGDTKISIINKAPMSFNSAQLKITKTYYDSANEKQVFEEIIWQTNYDYDIAGLILYRSHSGMTVGEKVYGEDEILDEEKSDANKQLFIPLAAGLTYFKIEAISNGSVFQTWASDKLPQAVKISLSFEPAYLDVDGMFKVTDEQLFSRTVAIDRTRQINFVFVAPDMNEFNLSDANTAQDFNDADFDDPDLSEPNDINLPVF